MKRWMEKQTKIWLKLKTAATSDLVIDRDVDGLVGRHAKHKRFPHTWQLLGAHQAEEGPLGDVRHGALAVNAGDAEPSLRGDASWLMTACWWRWRKGQRYFSSGLMYFSLEVDTQMCRTVKHSNDLQEGCVQILWPTPLLHCTCTRL